MEVLGPKGSCSLKTTEGNSKWLVSLEDKGREEKEMERGGKGKERLVVQRMELEVLLDAGMVDWT